MEGTGIKEQGHVQVQEGDKEKVDVDGWTSRGDSEMFEVGRRVTLMYICEDHTCKRCMESMRYIAQVSTAPETFAARLLSLGFLELCQQIWRKHFQQTMSVYVDDNNAGKVSLEVLRYSCLAVSRMSKASKDVCEKIIESLMHADIIKFFEMVLSEIGSQMLEKNQSQSQSQSQSQDLGPNTTDIPVQANEDRPEEKKETDLESKPPPNAMLTMLMILFNVVRMVDDARQIYEELGIVELLQKLREITKPADDVDCLAFKLNALIDNGEDGNLVNSSDDEVVSSLRTQLESSLDTTSPGSHDTSRTVELLMVINKLIVVGDDNKVKFVEAGFVITLTSCLQNGNVEIQTLAIDGIWHLAFTFPDEIKKEKSCVEALQSIMENEKSNYIVRRQASGALDTLGISYAATQVRGTSPDAESKQNKSTKQIFISYNHGSKDVVFKIKNCLKEMGYTIWIDDEQLRGSLANDITDGIDGASVVIVCMSHKYYESAYCKKEVIYSDSTKTEMIPLIVEPRYKPIGWLKFGIGDHLWIDFTQQESFETSLRTLSQRLRQIFDQLESNFKPKDCPQEITEPTKFEDSLRVKMIDSRPSDTETSPSCEPPEPIVTGYTADKVHLYWEKPSMRLVAGKDRNGRASHVKMFLQGYRLEINGKSHMRIFPGGNSCTITSCEPGKTCKIVLVALTCTAEVNRQRKKQSKVCNNTSSMSNVEINDEEWKSLPEDVDNDETPSKPITITIPQIEDAFLSEMKATYVMSKDEDGKKGLGHVELQWLPHGDDSSIRKYDVTWKDLHDGSIGLHHECLDPETTEFTIPVTRRKTVYDIVVEPEYEESFLTTSANVQHVQVLIPGPPERPEILVKSADENEFVVEWTEPRLWGTTVKGYQVYVNGKKVGSQLSSHRRKAVLPCRPNRNRYKINLVAISSEPLIGNSKMSNTLLVNTGPNSKSNPPTIKYAPGVDGGNDDDDTLATESDDNELKVRVVRVENSTIHLDWSDYQQNPYLDRFRIVWSSAAQPLEKQEGKTEAKTYVLRKCFPATNHYVQVFAVDKHDGILDKFRPMTIQTSAQPQPPIVRLRTINFNYAAIQWDKPIAYGDAVITGYKVFVDGILECTVDPDQFNYTFTRGEWYQKYVFQIQALTRVDGLVSCPSDPLEVHWPGVSAPPLRLLPSSKADSVKVAWESPKVTDGVEIKHYALIIMENKTERTIVRNVSPISSGKKEVEVEVLGKGEYLARLDVHIHGTSKIEESDLLPIILPTLSPEPPRITVAVEGLDKRRSLERKACDLLNYRDRLVNIIYTFQDDGKVASEAYDRLNLVDEKLDKCLATITRRYTGHLFVQISWKCTQSNPEIQVTGYKILLDGEQYGKALDSIIKSTRIELGVEKDVYKISIVSISEQPNATGAPSNVIEVLAESFQPFTYFSHFSLLSQSFRNGIGLLENCKETLQLERKQMLISNRPINEGILSWRSSPPSCNVMDVFNGYSRPLLSSTKSQNPTAILFWSKSCRASQKILQWFAKFAGICHPQCNFVAVACESGRVTQAMTSYRQKLVQVISELGCRDDTCIRHVFNQTLSTTTNTITARFSSNSLIELFRVLGVPTVVIVHPQNYVAWRGRYCAFDYSAFENFMNYILAEVMGKKNLPDPDPWNTDIDLDIDSYNDKKSSTSRAVVARQPQPTTAIVASGTARTVGNPLVPWTAREPKRETTIGVNDRPYPTSRTPPSKKNQMASTSPAELQFRMKMNRKV